MVELIRNSLTLESDPSSTGTLALDECLQHWRAARGCNHMPRRSLLRLADLKRHLAAMTLVETLSGMDDFRFRLVGTGVAQRFLADATGKTFREIYSPVDKSIADRIVRLHRDTLQKSVPILARVGTIWAAGNHYPQFDVLYLPLADDADKGAFVWSVYSFPKRAEETGRTSSGLPKPSADATALASVVLGD